MANKPQDALTQSILQDDLWKLMWQMSLPAIIGMSINGINAFFDGLFVGQFVGQNALAAVSLAFPLLFITSGLSAMIGAGGSAILSIAIGEEDEEKLEKIFGNVTTLAAIVSVVLMVFGIYFAPELIGMLGGEGEILELGVLYYRITLYGAFFRIYAVDLNLMIRAEGKIKIAMYQSIAAAVLNIVLNPILIEVFGLGVAGAAWATVISMAFLTLLGVLYYYHGKANYRVNLRNFSLDKEIVVPTLKIGGSAMMLQIMFFVQQFFVYRMIDKYGNDWDIALMGASYRVLLLMLFPGFGYAAALQPVAGINFGAGMYERVKKAFKIFCLSSSLTIVAFWLPIMFFPEAALSLMLPEAEFTNNDILNFRMMVLTLPLFPIFFMGTTLFQSIGRAKEAGLITIARELGLFVPALLILPMYFGVNGVYYAGVPVNFIVVVICLWMVWRVFGKWKGKKVLSKD